MVEGYIFFGMINTISNQIVLNFYFQTDAFKIVLRQLPGQISGILFSTVYSWWATKYKDLRWPLFTSFVIFFGSTTAFACMKPTPGWNTAQWVISVISGIGLAGPFTLVVTLVQYCAPHAVLATATGLAFSARAIGGAFGTAIAVAIVDSLITDRPAKVAAAAIAAGLPPTSVPILMEDFALGIPLITVPGATPAIVAAAEYASKWSYAKAYDDAWWSLLPFIVVAMICIYLLKDTKHLFTEHVEAPAEEVHKNLGEAKVEA